MDGLFGIFVGLLLLSLMMWLHELGHYLVGKRLGFKVNEFNIFMGPVLYSYYKNGVKYSLRSIPIGASVQFAGEGENDGDTEAGQEDSAEELEKSRARVTSAWGEVNSKPISGEEDSRLFNNRPKRARAALLLAGPLMNIVSGVLAFVIIFASMGYITPQISELSRDGQAQAAGLAVGDTVTAVNGLSIKNSMDWNYAYLFVKDGARVIVTYKTATGEEREAQLQPLPITRKMIGISRDASQAEARVLNVDPTSNGGSPVLQTGDLILKVNGQTVSGETVSTAVDQAGDLTIKLTVLRAGQELELVTVARLVETFNPIGLVFTEQHDFWGTIPYAVNFSASILKMTFSSIGQMISGQLNAKDALSGPIGIVDTISGVVTQAQVNVIEKFMQLLQLFALISLSLGLMNLLPIPLLDGSHLLLLVVEAIRGKRLSEKAQTAITMLGLFMIIGLFAVGIYFDISRIMTR